MQEESRAKSCRRLTTFNNSWAPENHTHVAMAAVLSVDSAKRSTEGGMRETKKIMVAVKNYKRHQRSGAEHFVATRSLYTRRLRSLFAWREFDKRHSWSESLLVMKRWWHWCWNRCTLRKPAEYGKAQRTNTQNGLSRCYSRRSKLRAINNWMKKVIYKV